jgi:hypothetical protein
MRCPLQAMKAMKAQLVGDFSKSLKTDWETMSETEKAPFSKAAAGNSIATALAPVFRVSSL